MLVVSTIVVVFVATFLCAGIAVAVAWILLQRRSYEESGGLQTDALGRSPDPPILLKDEMLSTIAVLSRLLARFDFVQSIKARIAEADLSWSVGRVTAMMLLAGALVTAVLMNFGWVPALGVVGGGCLAASAPYLYILRRRAARLALLEDQFPEALDFLARALRAGHPFAAAMDMLASESSPPLSVEIRKTFDEHQLGMTWAKALANLAQRVPLMDVSFFAASVELQHRTGGKFSEVFGRLAETMRERSALRGEIRSIAAHGRLTSLVLTLLPIVVVLVMTTVNPGYLRILVQHPWGKNLILAAVVSLSLGHIVIRKIVKVPL